MTYLGDDLQFSQAQEKRQELPFQALGSHDALAASEFPAMICLEEDGSKKCVEQVGGRQVPWPGASREALWSSRLETMSGGCAWK